MRPLTPEENERRVKDESLWFYVHKDELEAGHTGEWLVIRDHKVWGYFASDHEAIEFMRSKGIILGDYIVHECLSAEEERGIDWRQKGEVLGALQEKLEK
jgi:hypothetical protein